MQFSLILFFILILIFPEITVSGASNGLLLWFNNILPTLLPFLITSNLILKSNAINFITKWFSPFFCKLFHISSYSAFAVICGFFCGFPMGSKVTCDLLSNNQISLNEAKYLLSFCNNTSPMFLISYVMLQHLNFKHFIIPSILIFYLSPIICSFLFRKLYHITSDLFAATDTSIIKPSPSNALFDDCIMNAFEIITKVGGYIIIFSIIVQFSHILPFTESLPITIFTSFLEISNGIQIISESTIPFYLQYTLCMFLVSFGGLCSVVQTKSIISPYKISIIPYTIEKLVTALVTSLLTLFIQL